MSALRLVPLGLGLAAAGVGAAIGLGAERVAVGRPLLPGRPRGPRREVPLGSLTGPSTTVRTGDGTALYVEVDDLPADEAARAAAEHRPTVVLSHGYGLNLDFWHVQRLALRGRYRLVLWDQRGHGRSQRGPQGSATIDQVGEDLAAVVAATAPEGPLVLLGHSMGGMAVMALAARDPDLVAERVVGTALVSTSSGGMEANDFGFAALAPLLRRVAPTALGLLSRQAALVERTRALGGDLEALLVRHWSYASDVPEDVVDFTSRMIAGTRVEVIDDFFPAFAAHDKADALGALAGGEVLVLVGADDLLTPPSHSEEIVRRLPAAELVVVPDAGHLVPLEHPEVVQAAVEGLLERALRLVEHDRRSA
ncbi:alpha/beta hydrolase [Pseudokineococcus lusitanus]|uniref:Pimeloyl-ACP methyl ester carboxylesterase n=1 Tax=Pseudokineococcus lusitanus TaxID=763993 RepID=A0A3N1HL06_9ACTN|nr:alpha/beta hydrolase [Pseudokineococcus lusitanus]ROP43180.1 pimeloyl-ACP methyl ester carboxylesterase [Pseudokineococcus lusitanus]